jgi:hypothetical protein
MNKNWKLKKNLDDTYDDNFDNFNDFNIIKIHTFYQVCEFPLNKKYMIRKITFNNLYDLQKISNLSVDKKTFLRFLNKSPECKRLMYATNTLDNIPMPSEYDFSVAASQLLN